MLPTATTATLPAQLQLLGIRALIFDLDGVITQTATVHAHAWKKMFDEYLQQRGQKDGKTYQPLHIATDYPKYIDGIPRYDGVRNFLTSRQISLPEGNSADAPGTETIAGLGNLKNTYFHKVLAAEGVKAFPDAVAFIEEQRKLGRRTAIISASKNCRAILQAANLEALFEVRVDGEVSAELGLPGKPAPDIFLEAARQLNISPAEAAIFEDARAGVKAGKAGNFALVIGVNRKEENETEALLHNGADLVITNFNPETEIKTMNDPSEITTVRSEAGGLPDALKKLTEWREKYRGKKPAVFLDYDGCLTPIVQNPEDAILSPEMRLTLQQLAEVCPVAVVSGRDRANVANLVQLDNLYYAGSHGFDITGPNNLKTEPGGAAAALPALDQAEKTLQEKLQKVPGALVERKKYAIAVHYRNVAETQVAGLRQVVEETIAQHPELKKGLGKKVLELKPNLDWHKGKAVLYLLEELKLDGPEFLPMYIGDDITDEDAFTSLRGRGLTILVGDHDAPTAAEFHLENVAEVEQFLAALREF